MSKEFQIRNGNLIASFDLENEDGDIDFCKLFKVSHGVADEIGMFVDYVATNKIIKTQSKHISDLEAKLADSEENNKLLEIQLQDMERSKLSWENQYFTLYNNLKNYREVTEKKHLLDETEWQDYCAFKHIEPQIKGCLDREREYEKQLAEKDKLINAYADDLEKVANENADLVFKLADKEKKNDELQDKLHSYYEQIMNKGTCGLCKYVRTDYKISFAVEQLEKVKELLFSKAIQITGTSVDGVRLYSINEIFSNQINELKEME